MAFGALTPFLLAVITYIALAMCMRALPRSLRENVLAGTSKDDPAIIALRGIAAVAVLCAHAFDYTDLKHAQSFFASFGVCTFFMITGYLFYSMAASGRLNLGSYYRKRIYRLVPAAFLAIAIIQFLDWAQWGFHALDSRQVVAILRNFMFGFVGDMFGVTALNDLGSIVQKMGMIWTLKWEWLFYITFPVAIAFAKGSFLRLTLFTAAIYLAFYPPSDVLVTSAGNFMLLFLIGAACAWMLQRLPGYSTPLILLGWMAWFSGLVCYLIFLPNENLMGGRLDFNIAITAPFLFLSLKTRWGDSALALRLIKSNGVQMLGIVSYSFYLYHMAILYYSQFFARGMIASENGVSGNMYTFATLIPVGLLVSLVAMASYLHIERRFMQNLQHIAVRRPDVETTTR